MEVQPTTGPAESSLLATFEKNKSPENMWNLFKENPELFRGGVSIEASRDSLNRHLRHSWEKPNLGLSFSLASLILEVPNVIIDDHEEDENDIPEHWSEKDRILTRHRALAVLWEEFKISEHAPEEMDRDIMEHLLRWHYIDGLIKPSGEDLPDDFRRIWMEKLCHWESPPSLTELMTLVDRIFVEARKYDVFEGLVEEESLLKDKVASSWLKQKDVIGQNCWESLPSVTGLMNLMEPTFVEIRKLGAGREDLMKANLLSEWLRKKRVLCLNDHSRNDTVITFKVEINGKTLTIMPSKGMDWRNGTRWKRVCKDLWKGLLSQNFTEVITTNEMGTGWKNLTGLNSLSISTKNHNHIYPSTGERDRPSYISALPSGLTSLKLEGVTADCSHIFGSVSKMTDLEELTYKPDQLTQDEVNAIGKLTQLKELYLPWKRKWQAEDLTPLDSLKLEKSNSSDWPNNLSGTM